MSTHHSTEVAPYEGEYVWAEILDDDAPGPQQEKPGPSRRPAAVRVGRYTAAALRAVAGGTVPGLRHAWAATAHWTTLAYMSDEEIRRRMVKRHLDTYLEQREDVTADINRLGKKAQKLTRDAVDFGLTTEEGRRLKDLGTELKLRRTAGAALAQIPFDIAAVQPTREQIRRYRTVRALGRFAGVLLPAGSTALALVLAAPAAGLVAVPVLAGAAWWLGRHPLALTQRALPAYLVGPRELEKPDMPTVSKEHETVQEEAKPFPIRDVTSCEDAQEALRRALLAQGCDIEGITGVVREPWGWTARVVFASGSPEELAETGTYRRLITLLKLRRNGLLVETDPESGDTCTVRMILTDPFTPELVGPAPYRAPLSMSITDLADYGVAMDATPLAFTLAGLMLLMVADSGGGKSGVMLAMAEVATACYDAVTLNLDPAGTGIGDLEQAITLSACMDDEAICAVLEFLLSWCSARARQRARYGWGNKWRVSREHPAVCVFGDEWPQLSERAKRLLVRLLLLGRKEAIWVYAGSQFGTKDYLGEAIGPKLSAKLLGACRRVDITELLGAGAVAEGYRADLLQAATHTQPNDAGQIYATGLPGMPNKPTRYQVREITPEHAARVAAERRTAGLVDLGHTLTEAGLLHQWRALQKLCAALRAGTADREVPPVLQLLRGAFTKEDDPAFLTMDQIHTCLKAADPARWGAWDDRDDVSRLRELGKALSRALRDAGVDLPSERLKELAGQPRGYRLTAIQDAIEATA
ncbi:hypothetical protein [Streptomyces natalensis]|uniref:FtsK domain-containing protein n=1 Tax=Streptomyces natalensis ATCC 27448 TaxID=1240678 RepID=A0A0D7CPN1_9ACTN|nr:hypothetical protein [Streptomyces natalensis]KIZ17362.1 hypothetical protein SNA_15260 [Streptomyces natalensis ATCC 27448]